MSTLVFHHPVQTFHGTGALCRFTEAPEHCPACGRPAEPRPLAAHSTSPDDQLVDFAFQCPHDTCRRVFVADYTREPGGGYELMAAAAPALGEHTAGAPADTWR